VNVGITPYMVKKGCGLVSSKQGDGTDYKGHSYICDSWRNLWCLGECKYDTLYG